MNLPPHAAKLQRAAAASAPTTAKAPTARNRYASRSESLQLIQRLQLIQSLQLIQRLQRATSAYSTPQYPPCATAAAAATRSVVSLSALHSWKEYVHVPPPQGT